MKKRYSIVLSLGILTLFTVILFSLGMGTYEMSPSEIIQVFLGKGTKMQETVIYTLRLPRIAVALFVGLAFSTAGCILQTTTSNELADPGIIGINAGASLAVVLLISAGGATYYHKIGALSMFLMPFVAVAGAFVASLLIYVLSYKKGIRPTRLILVGIGVNAGINAFITLYQMNLSQGDYNRALVWISGSLWGSGWSFFYIIAPMTLILFVLAMYKAKILDVLSLGDELATGLGVSVSKEQKRLLLLAVILAAVATAVAGNIAFLGLLGPQIAKRIVGPVHRRLLPMAGVLSMLLIVVADMISRNLFSPIEIPVGITISMIGVPYFIYLMLRSKE